MGVLRTALALGALSISVPVLAQDSRYGWDRARAERNRDPRGDRNDGRNEGKGNGRGESRGQARSEGRTDNRGVSNGWEREHPRGEPRVGIGLGGREEHWENPRVVVRPPVGDRYDHRDGRVGHRYAPYPGRVTYRYGDRDFRQRDLLTITAWFRSIGPNRISVYGGYDRRWPAQRIAFRPGLYLSMDIFARLDPLPYEIELELGDLPWYLERRIYGRTVLVIDTRTRMVVDLYDVDY